MVGLVQFVPSCFEALFVGHAADRYDRRSIVAIAQLLEALALLSSGFSILHLIDRNTILCIVFRSELPETSNTRPFKPVGDGYTGSASRSDCKKRLGTIAIITGAGMFRGGLYYGGMSLFSVGNSNSPASQQQQRVMTAREPAALTLLFAGIAYIRSKPVLSGDFTGSVCRAPLVVYPPTPIFARDILAGWARNSEGPCRRNDGVALSDPETAATEGGQDHVRRAVAFGLATVVFALSTSIVLSCLALVLLG